MLNVATASPTRRSDTATTQTADKKSAKTTYDNILYLSGFTGQSFAPDRRTVRNLNKSTIAQLLTVEKKPPVSKRVAPDYSWFKPPRQSPVLYYCYPEPAPVPMLGPGPQPVALIPATCPVKSITAPLVEAAKRKELAAMVIQHPTADILPNSHTLPVAANGTRLWASASPTPGLPSTVATKGMAEMLYRATERGDPDGRAKWLIGDSRRHSGAH